MLSENVEVEGSTFSNDKNMLKSEINNYMTELYDWIIANTWESDGRLDHVTTESYDLGHEGIGDDNRRSPTVN